MPRHLHRDALGDAGAHEIANGGTAEVVKHPPWTPGVSTGTVKREPEALDPVAAAMKHRRTDHPVLSLQILSDQPLLFKQRPQLSRHRERAKGLALLGEVRRVPVNRLVNEAVGEYLETRAASVEAELQETLRRVKAYREADPNFESAISRFADAEAKLATDDPVEGRTTRATGPTQRLVRELIRG